MTTKDMIIQQLNDKLAAAIEQEKQAVGATLFAPAEEPEQENANDQAE